MANILCLAVSGHNDNYEPNRQFLGALQGSEHSRGGLVKGKLNVYYLSMC